MVAGNPAIAYYSDYTRGLRYARSSTATGHHAADWTVIVVDSEGENVGVYCSLAVVAGNPAISYQTGSGDGMSGDLMYARSSTPTGMNTEDWTSLVLVEGGDTGEFTSLAVVDGLPAISFHDSTTGNLRSCSHPQQPGHLPTTDPATFAELWDAITSGHEWRGELLNRKKNGEEYWGLITISPMRNERGEITHFFGWQHDVTELKKAESAMRVSEEKYRSLFENASDSIFLSDTETLKFIDVNENAARTLGYSREELIGQDVGSIGSEDGVRQMASIIAELQSKQSIMFESTHIHKDGHEIPVEISSQIVELEGRRAFQSFVRDISERKLAEDVMRHARQQAEEASLAKTRFIAGMSHELRTPLSTILGFGGILVDEVFGTLNEKQVRKANGIVTAGEHLLQIINDLLDLAKIESGAMELRCEPLDLRQISREAYGMFAGSSEKSQVQMLLELPDTPVIFMGDALRLKQVMLNLLSNSHKFTHEGKITLYLTQNNGQLLWGVKDTGIGIKPDRQQEVFRPFVQVGDDQGIAAKGSGLGLALCKEIVLAHGGKITQDSEEGKGRDVRITLANNSLEQNDE